jgi:hypothetical protein
MSNQNASERAAALLKETIDAFQRGENVPHSPIDAFVPGKTRRSLRRFAERLRRGEAQPRYRNLYTAEQLAGICERAAQRDEIRQQVSDELLRIGREMYRLIHEDPEGVRQTFVTFFREARRRADEDGPGSEAAQRYRQLQRISEAAKMERFDRRRQKLPDRPRVAEAPDAAGRLPMIPAEPLDSAPPGEAVLFFPAVGEDSGRARMLLRIGVGASSWIGSFESGLDGITTVSIMPDGKHLFVSALGAGYIIELKSRTLVERTGTEIVGVFRDPAMTLFVVNHNNERFEAFGPGDILNDER